MIELAGVGKRYGEAVAVDHVDMTVPEGSVTALIGPSGCGKSTLLRLMIGLIEADTGEVRFEGRALSDWPVIELRRRFGYAIQSGGLFPHLTSRQNVELPARAAGRSRGEREARVGELAELMHLPAEMLDRFPGELSGGQRQRVALMRALVLDPGVLLLDEPLGALDPMIRGELQREFRELFERLGKTVVIVTHDLAEAAYLAPRDIVLLRAGRIVQRGAFSELRGRPAEPFVGEFIDGQVERVAALVSSEGA